MRHCIIFEIWVDSGRWKRIVHFHFDVHHHHHHHHQYQEISVINCQSSTIKHPTWSSFVSHIWDGSIYISPWPVARCNMQCSLKSSEGPRRAAKFLVSLQGVDRFGYRVSYIYIHIIYGIYIYIHTWDMWDMTFTKKVVKLVMCVVCCMMILWMYWWYFQLNDWHSKEVPTTPAGMVTKWLWYRGQMVNH